MNTATVLLLAGLLVVEAVCIRLDTRPAAVPADPSFRKDVLPSLVASGCAGCHGDDGGLSVLTVRALLTGGDNGPAVLAGHPDSSDLVKAIVPNFPLGPRMPAAAKQRALAHRVREGAVDEHEAAFARLVHRRQVALHEHVAGGKVRLRMRLTGFRGVLLGAQRRE